MLLPSVGPLMALVEPTLSPLLPHATLLFTAAQLLLLLGALVLQSPDTPFRLCFFAATWLFLARYFLPLNTIMLALFSVAALLPCPLPKPIRWWQRILWVAAMLFLLLVTACCSPWWAQQRTL